MGAKWPCWDGENCCSGLSSIVVIWNQSLNIPKPTGKMRVEMLSTASS